MSRRLELAALSVWIVGLSCVALWVWSCLADWETERTETRRYCEKVQSGAWPDYRKDYAKVCPADASK